MVRALASHQCVPGSIPGPGVICGLSLLLVLFSAPRGFSPGPPVFPSPQKPTFLNSNSIWNCSAQVKMYIDTCALQVNKLLLSCYKIYEQIHTTNESIVNIVMY